MTVKLYFFAALLGLAAAVQAQTTSSSKVSARFENLLGNQTVYLGIMGSGVFLSANYDIRFSPNQLGWGIYAGIGYTPGFDNTGSYRDYRDSLLEWKTRSYDYPDKLTVPFGVSYLMGNAYSPHRVEFGLGFTYMNGDSELFDQKTTSCTWLLIPKVAYRRYYFDKRLMWRVGLTPIVSLSGSEFPFPWLEGGIGIRL